MPHVFISHRAVPEDLALARALRDALADRGHTTFLAGDSLSIGESWPERIATELGDADVVLLLLSPAAAQSEMVIEEVRQARDLKRRTGRPRLMPVRVGEAPGAPLPYDLGAYLGRLQQVGWFGPEDTPALVHELGRVLSARWSDSGAADRSETPSLIGADARLDATLSPAAAAPGETARASKRRAVPLQPPGAPYSAAWYVSHDRAERDAVAYLAQPGSPVVVVGPYQSGKSWLLSRVLESARGPGDLTVNVNLDHLPEDSLSALDGLLLELATELCEACGLPEDVLPSAWRPPAHPQRKLTALLEKRVLPAATGRLLLAIDRADAVLSHDYHAAFFGLLRSWAERASRPPWDRLRLLCAISTEPSLLVDSANMSPFNLSVPIRLDELTEDQVRGLAERHGLSLSRGDLDALHTAVGGHPWLVRLTLFEAAHAGRSVAEIASAPEGGGLYGDHLRSRLLRLRANPELGDAVRRILVDPSAPIDYIVAHRLIAAGIITAQRGQHRLRYPLYRDFFAGRL